MPVNENTVVIPSIIGFLSCVKYKTTIASAVKINVIAESISRSFFDNYVLIISELPVFKCEFHLKNPTTCIGI